MRYKCGLAAFLLVSACSPESRASALEADGQDNIASNVESQDIEAKLERLIQADPDAGPIFAGLKQHFPDHYDGIKRRAIEAVARGASLQEGSKIGRAAMQSFVQANRRNMAVAPTPNLVAYAQAQVQLFEIMQQEDEHLCAKYSMGDRRPSSYVAPPIRQATSNLALTMIRAARQGIDNPTNRLFQTISDEDAAAYRLAFARQGVPESFIELMADERGLARASSSQQCASGLINARTIASLSPEITARWVAFMLTQ